MNDSELWVAYIVMGLTVATVFYVDGFGRAAISFFSMVFLICLTHFVCRAVRGFK